MVMTLIAKLDPEVVLKNIEQLYYAAARFYPDYARNKSFRLSIPKYVCELLHLYQKRTYMCFDSEEMFLEGMEYRRIPICYALEDVITIGSVDFKFISANPPMIKMTDFLTANPIINHA